MKKYLVVIEKASKGYSAFCPDIPGCIATAKSKTTAEQRMRTALKFHFDGLRAGGQRIPVPKSYSKYFEVEAT